MMAALTVDPSDSGPVHLALKLLLSIKDTSIVHMQGYLPKLPSLLT